MHHSFSGNAAKADVLILWAEKTAAGGILAGTEVAEASRYALLSDSWCMYNLPCCTAI